MKIKKLKKLSIFVMTFTLIMSVIPVNAADSDEVDLTVTVSPYFSLSQNGSQTTTGVVKRASTTSLEFTTPIALSYSLSSNEESQIRISATAPVSDGTGSVNALFGTAANAMKIVFTKSDSTTTSSAVTDASSSSPTASSNAKAIAFNFTATTPTIAVSSVTEDTPSVSVSDNALLYDFGSGIYTLPFSVNGASISNTFSNDDVGGNYKATLVIEKVEV